MTTRSPQRANRRVALAAALVVAGMAGLAYASVPLYRLFCQATGYGGTTQRAAQPPAEAGKRVITVRFNADIGGTNLPWSFQPVDRAVSVHVGEERLIHYRATNRGTEPIVGTATFNVTPAKAGLYFEKIACFCFQEQRLDPGETADLPVSFFIDPALASDPNLRDVDTITLSYTFFRAKPGAENLSQSSNRGAASPTAAN